MDIFLILPLNIALNVLSVHMRIFLEVESVKIVLLEVILIQLHLLVALYVPAELTPQVGLLLAKDAAQELFQKVELLFVQNAMKDITQVREQVVV